jgi:hypothetical protein
MDRETDNGRKNCACKKTETLVLGISCLVLLKIGCQLEVFGGASTVSSHLSLAALTKLIKYRRGKTHSMALSLRILIAASTHRYRYLETGT